jgi:hypothetical protein
VKAQDVDDLPKYIKDKLKPAHKSKLKALIGGQLPAAGGRAAAPALSTAPLVKRGRLLNRVSHFVSYNPFVMKTNMKIIIIILLHIITCK